VVVDDSEAGGHQSATAAISPDVHDGVGRYVHLLSVTWLVAMVAAVLGPALAHGSSFGSYDILSQFGLLQRHGIMVHNFQAGDQVDAAIPWSTLAWTQIHHGHFPLWDPYAALGLPLALNWQSAAFGLPALVSYLFPLNLAFTVQVFLTLVIAGTGVYVLGRVLRLSVLACVFAGTVFELSGPMLGWLGSPLVSVASCAGWLFAVAILLLRGEHRIRHISLLALVVAATIYAGQPQALLLLGLALVVFMVVVLAFRIPRLGGSGPIRLPVLDAGLAAVAGAALGAPLLLPGLQILSIAQRQVQGQYPPLPVHDLVHLITQSFDGLPLAGNHWFGDSFYAETAAYVGVITLVLAVVGVAVRWRRPEVIALGTVAVIMAAITFVPAVDSLLNRVLRHGQVEWRRALLFLAFALALLAGVGMDAVIRAHNQRNVRRWTGIGFVVSGVVLVALWKFGRGHLTSAEASIRDRSFIWPTVDTVVGLVVGALVLVHRRSVATEGGRTPGRIGIGQLAAVAFLACETVFLAAAGSQLWSSSNAPFAPTPAVRTLQRAAGSSLVALGSPNCFFPPGLGIPQNTQLIYGVQELAFYDPSAPESYFSSWSALTGARAGYPNYWIYCPGITSLSEARLYGVSFVLEYLQAPAPKGAVFDVRVGKEALYRIPGSASATLTALPAAGGLPAVEAPGTPVPVTHPDPSSWKLVTRATTPQMLRLRLTDVPGWHATIDGQPLQLVPFSGVMLQARVPAGTHTVKLWYWPAALSTGITIALCSVGGLSIAVVIGALRLRQKRPG